jgi:hypothetical protein
MTPTRLKVDDVCNELVQMAVMLEAEAVRLRAMAHDIYVYGGVYINPTDVKDVKPQDYPPDHPAPGDLGSVPL